MKLRDNINTQKMTYKSTKPPKSLLRNIGISVTKNQFRNGKRKFVFSRAAFRVSRIFVSIVFVLSYIFVFSYDAHAAQLYLYPDNLDVRTGASFVVEVRLDTEGESVNAIDITGTVENGIIESITTANSIIDIFIDATAVGQNTFHFSGGTPGGFVGSGIVGRLSITATKPGSLSISFGNATILSGSGESLLSEIKVRSATENVLQPNGDHIIITSKSHPNQNEWYNEKDLKLHWNLENGMEYSYLMSLDPGAVPDDTPDKPQGTLEWQGDISINDLTDGINYFTLKRVGENSVARYRAMIDTVPPEWLGFEKSAGVAETEYKDFLSFLAKDELSGINHYEVGVDDSPSVLLTSQSYILPSEYTHITITAFDNAGNITEKDIVSSTAKKITLIYVIAGLMVIGAVIVMVRPLRKRVFTKEN